MWNYKGQAGRSRQPRAIYRQMHVLKLAGYTPSCMNGTKFPVTVILDLAEPCHLDIDVHCIHPLVYFAYRFNTVHQEFISGEFYNFDDLMTLKSLTPDLSWLSLLFFFWEATTGNFTWLLTWRD